MRTLENGRSGLTTRHGFTLIELVVVMTTIAILSTMAVPKLSGALEQARVAGAIGDIKAIEREIDEFELIMNRMPSSLAEVNRSAMRDPWGQAYGYARPGTRTDQFGVVINTDYDLYSIGSDGGTNASLTSATARDDVVRGNNGGFVGLASDY
ncbi:MAG: type II secretion system protein GspG [Longimicrobiales bacterium]